MADRTLTINHADGDSETYTLKTEDVLGVREMSRGHVYPALVLTEQNQPYYNVTKTDDRNLRIVSDLVNDGEIDARFLAFTPSDLRLGKNRVTFDITLNSGDISNQMLRLSYRDNQTALQPVVGSNTFDMEIIDDGFAPDPAIYFAINGDSAFDVSVSNLKITHEPDTVTVDRTPPPETRTMSVNGVPITISRATGGDIRTIFIDGQEVIINRTQTAPPLIYSPIYYSQGGFKFYQPDGQSLYLQP